MFPDLREQSRRNRQAPLEDQGSGVGVEPALVIPIERHSLRITANTTSRDALLA